MRIYLGNVSSNFVSRPLLFWTIGPPFLSAGPLLDCQLSDRKLEAPIGVLSRICFSPESKIGKRPRRRKSKMSSDDPVRPRQHIRRNRQTDPLGGL
jgi:hypothetical protein